MNFAGILTLSVGLAMDATAVSATRGMALRAIRPRHVLLVALFFGGFQALMPVVGYLVGARIGPLVEAWDHWIAFAVLGGIGAKMLWEARRSTGEPAPRREEDLFGFKVMLALAVATSIDALAVGVTLALIGANIIVNALAIGTTTFVLVTIGMLTGRFLGEKFGHYAEAAGGIVLILIGVAILAEHTLG